MDEREWEKIKEGDNRLLNSYHERSQPAVLAPFQSYHKITRLSLSDGIILYLAPMPYSATLFR